MPTSQDNVSRILAALAQPLRRKILLNLSEKGECSFTDLMNVLDVDTGKLSFHIRSLEGLLEQTPAGKYKLSKAGENAVRLIRDLEAWVLEAEAVREPSTLPLASFKKRVFAFLIDFAIAFVVFLILPNIFSIAQALINWPNIFSLMEALITKDLTALSNIILFALVLFWVYFTLLEGFAGQSLGKRLIGITVVRLDGKKPFYDVAAVRNFGKVFLLPFDLLVGYRLKDERFIRYFDKFAGTTVKDLRP